MASCEHIWYVKLGSVLKIKSFPNKLYLNYKLYDSLDFKRVKASIDIGFFENFTIAA